MLQILRYSNPRQLRPLFQKVDPFADTLLISHLRTKIEIQDIILDKKGFVVDEALMRISEFSETLFKRLCPEYRILNRDLAELKIKNFLQNQGASLELDPELASSLLEFVEFMGTYLCFPQPRQQIEEWLTDHPGSEGRWKKWFLVGRLICDMFTNSGKVLKPWVTSILVDRIANHTVGEAPGAAGSSVNESASHGKASNNSEQLWSRRIWADLRNDITWSEAELFLQLSKKMDVVVLIPQLKNLPAESRSRKIYDYLSGFEVKNQPLPSDILASETPHALESEAIKVSGALAEVRTTVSMIRTWLGEGIKPQHIAVVAPQIEDYWPIFDAYFRKE
ncbi:MAG: hypothetical protein V4736_14060, partial [Bdellovibrionota bacterium]